MWQFNYSLHFAVAEITALESDAIHAALLLRRGLVRYNLGFTFSCRISSVTSQGLRKLFDWLIRRLFNDCASTTKVITFE